MKELGKLKIKKSSEIKKSIVSIGFECLDRELFTPEKCYAPLGDSGVKYARCQTGWARCEREKGVYDFAWLDGVVDGLLEKGVEPWFCVGFGNPIYMPDAPNRTAVGCVPLLYGDEVYTAWKNYVRALSEHFCGRVKEFEIWNEPDINHFWYPGESDPKLYAKLVKDTGAVIKKAIPDAKIGAVSAKFANFAFVGKLIEYLDPCDIDFFCIHIYTTVPEFRFPYWIRQMRSFLCEHGFSHVEIWQGESGYPSWASKGHWLLRNGTDNERSQAVCMLRRYFIDLCSGIKRVSHFQMVDLWEKPYEMATSVQAKPAGHGILRGITYEPKESYRTISNLASLMTDDIKPEPFYASVDYITESVCEFISTQVMTFKKGGSPICVYYIPTDVAEEMKEPRIVTVEMFGKLEEPVLIDMYNGTVYEIEDSEEGEYTSKFKDIPLYDYPLVITEGKLIELA